jgi:hypothetical protein
MRTGIIGISTKQQENNNHKEAAKMQSLFHVSGKSSGQRLEAENQGLFFMHMERRP